MNNYERRVLGDTVRNIDYMLSFFFHDKKEHEEAIACLNAARDIISTKLNKEER